MGVKFEGAAPVVSKAFSKPPTYQKPLAICCLAAALAGWLLWPNDAETPPVSVDGMPGEATGLVLGFSW